MQKNILITNPAVPGAEEVARIAMTNIDNNADVSDILDYGKTRNRVIGFSFGGRRYVVKYFGRPAFPARLLSLFGRRSKARKSYENSKTVIEAGFDAATPVAYWEQRCCGVLISSGFLSYCIDLPLVSLIYDESYPRELRDSVRRDLSAFMLRLHTAGLWPKDFNIGNILLNPRDPEGERRFWLIDLNRFRSGAVPSMREAMLSFDQLGVRPQDYPFTVAPYAAAKGWDLKKCTSLIEKFHRRYALLKRLKHPFRH